MKTFNVIVLLLGTCSLFFLSTAFACVQTFNSEFAIAGSYESGQQAYSGASSYLFGGCKKFAGQYFVLVSAPTYTDPLFKSISSPEGELAEERCFIDHSPFKVSKPEEIGIENFYRSEVSFLNNCLQVEVTDSRGQIDAQTQINCEITQVSSSTVIAKGPRCAFKISENSSFSIRYRLNPSCLNLAYLKENGDIRPMDVKASLGVYKATDLSSGSPDYDILSMMTGRITLQPSKDLLPVSKYAGTVGSEWPMQYGTQVEFGKVGVTVNPRMRADPIMFLKAPFLVNNNCPEVCKNGLCTSPCDFYAPVAARMTLKKKAPGENVFHAIDYWYQGNLVPARFLGEMSFGRILADQNIQEGDTYLLVAEFSNPALSYRAIVDQAKQLVIHLQPVAINTSEIDRNSKLPGLGGLDGSSMVPIYSALAGLGVLGDHQTSTDEYLGVLNSMIGLESSWPPYYTSIINGDLKDNPNRIYLTLKAEFRIAGIPGSGAVRLDNIQYSKESKIFGTSDTPITIQPQIKCINP